MSMQRWKMSKTTDVTINMTTEPDGEWVRFEDARAFAEKESLDRAIEELEKFSKIAEDNQAVQIVWLAKRMRSRIAELKAQKGVKG